MIKTNKVAWLSLMTLFVIAAVSKTAKGKSKKYRTGARRI
jgi:hypothetical protein